MHNSHSRLISSSGQRWLFFRKNRLNATGFTTVELLVVLCMVLICASISAPLLLKRPPTADIKHALNQLVLLCQCAQYHAYASGRPQVISINTRTKTCTLKTAYGSWLATLPRACRFGFLRGAHGSPGDPTHKIVQAVTFPADGDHFKIICTPVGTISPGTAYVLDTKTTRMGAFTCSDSGVSCIKMYLYHQRSWQLLQT